MTNTTHASTEYPAERLGNTNPIAAAVKEVIDTPHEAGPVASKVTADRMSGGDDALQGAAQEPQDAARSRPANPGRTVDAVRSQVADMTDQVVAYTRAEPAKALMIAAAAGAVLMMVLGSTARSRR